MFGDNLYGQFNPFLTDAADGLTLAVLVAGLLLAILPWLKHNSAGRIIPVAIVMVLTARYFVWRVTETLPLHGTKLDLIVGVLFLALEAGSIIGSTITYLTMTRTTNRTPEVNARLPALLALEKPPLVDVFICTYNEEANILERTIVGATGMSYPNFRVWVLDDGRRPWLRDLAAQLGCNYLDRPDNKGAKAGNINHALKHVATLSDRPEFVSVLDADFVPTASFLSRAMSLFHATDVAIVQTPQHFINQDPIQANLRAAEYWPDEQRFFFDVIQPAKDAWGIAFCCGTSSVIRLAALDRLGGFPTDSVTEDYLLSIRMKRIGFRTVYLNERLSLGLAPETLADYMTQRRRWALGFMQIMRGPDGPLRLANGLPLIDRIGLIDSFLYWTVSFMMRIACLIVPILYLVFGIQAVDASFSEGLSHFLPYYIAQIVVVAWMSGGRVMPVLTDISQLLASRQIMIAVFVGLFRPKGHKFVVTAKSRVRGEAFINWKPIAIISVILALNVLGILITFLDRNNNLLGSSSVALFWTWYNTLMLVTALACCVEQPRFRKHEREACREPVTLAFHGSRWMTTSINISAGGILVEGVADAPLGTQVSLRFAGRTLKGKIVRKSNDDTAVRFDNQADMRTFMIRKVYASHRAPTFEHTHAARLAQRVASRIME